jgi:hypothetical protein
MSKPIKSLKLRPFKRAYGLPVPQVTEAIRLGREIIGCSALKNGPQIYMKFAFANGDTSAVSSLLGIGTGFVCLLGIRFRS